MAEIVDLAEHRYDPHLHGEARCTGCKHEFHVVQPVGSAEPFECPSCGTLRAYRKYVCLEAVGGMTWECKCGSEVFYIRRPSEKAQRASGRTGRDEGWIVCVGCGTAQSLVAIWA